ncbi:MAG: acyltransferase family protein [Pseudomonadota bacterium]|nr:acyltransferase family protein [Pseudomonadota bacterium]
MIGKAYRPEIDGLRAIAVVAVILFHAHGPWLPGGFVGVDIFFVISGFLITTIIQSEITGGSFSILTFYDRRARRILPALGFVCACTTIAAFVVMTPGELRNFGQSLLATSLFASNIYFFLKTGYFAPRSEDMPLLHTWSLAVEEQFYILFPLILLVLAMRLSRWTFQALAGLFFLSFAISVWLGPANPMANFFLLPSRGWELLAGSLLAFRYTSINAALDRAPALRTLAEFLGLALVCWSIFALDGRDLVPGLLALPVILGTVLMLAAMTDQSLVGRILSWKPFVVIGLISYSAYLWHQPIFAFLRLTTQNQSAAMIASALAFTIALSWLSWRYVETPFRDRSRFGRGVILGSSAAMLAVFAMFGATAHMMRGLPERFSTDVRALAATIEASPLRETCHTDGVDFLTPEASCVIGAKQATWAVLGDSHGVELAYVLGKELEKQGQAARQLTFSRCPPAIDFDPSNPGCRDWFQKALAVLANDSAITHVVFAYRYGLHLYGDPAAGDIPRPVFLSQRSAQDARSAFWSDFGIAIDQLKAAGKTVFLLGPVPELPQHVDRYVFDRDAMDPKTQGVDRDDIDTRLGPIRDALDSLNAAVLDPADVLCTVKHCSVVQDGKALYFDDNHLGLNGAKAILPRLLDIEPRPDEGQS